MSEPTKKEMKGYLKFWHKECIPDKDNEPCESCPEDVRDRCLEVEDAILALIEHGPDWTGWTPTAENINALPKPLRKFIHDLETNCDPPSLVRENICLKETCGALQKKLIEHRPEVDEAFMIKPPTVSREFVEEKIKYLAEHPSQHRLEMVLIEAGVTVKEG